MKRSKGHGLGIATRPLHGSQHMQRRSNGEEAILTATIFSTIQHDNDVTLSPDSALKHGRAFLPDSFPWQKCEFKVSRWPQTLSNSSPLAPMHRARFGRAGGKNPGRTSHIACSGSLVITH